MLKVGINVSECQRNFNFRKAMLEGIKYAILKAGGGNGELYQDESFESHYKEAKACGLGVGAYFLGAASSVTAAQEEADKFLDIIKGKQLDYPVYYSVGKYMDNQEKEALTDIVSAFCERVQAAGYYVGICSSETTSRKLDDERLAHFARFIVKYGRNKPNNDCGIWQYGGKTNYIRSNRVAGVICDQSYCYTDYPALIRREGLNGYTDGGGSGQTILQKTIDELAQEVIIGKWGDGDECKANLTAAGYDYDAVKVRVDELFANTNAVTGQTHPEEKPTDQASSEEKPTEQKSNKEVAQEVVDGLWGGDPEYKERLKAAGYNLSVIQRFVNKLKQ